MKSIGKDVEKREPFWYTLDGSCIAEAWLGEF